MMRRAVNNSLEHSSGRDDRGTRPWHQHLSRIAMSFPLARPPSAELAQRPVCERYVDRLPERGVGVRHEAAPHATLSFPR